MDAATRASRYSAVLVERLWTLLEEEKTKVGGSYPLDLWSRLTIFLSVMRCPKRTKNSFDG